jgi:hypothetical protein
MHRQRAPVSLGQIKDALKQISVQAVRGVRTDARLLSCGIARREEMGPSLLQLGSHCGLSQAQSLAEDHLEGITSSWLRFRASGGDFAECGNTRSRGFGEAISHGVPMVGVRLPTSPLHERSDPAGKRPGMGDRLWQSAEFQMCMSVDEPRQQQPVTQIDFPRFWLIREADDPTVQDRQSQSLDKLSPMPGPARTDSKWGCGW